MKQITMDWDTWEKEMERISKNAYHRGILTVGQWLQSERKWDEWNLRYGKENADESWFWEDILKALGREGECKAIKKEKTDEK